MSSLADVHGALKEIDPSLLLRPKLCGRSLGRRSERPAQRDRITARGLADMPSLAGPLAEGRMNVEHAAILAAAAEPTPPGRLSAACDYPSPATR